MWAHDLWSAQMGARQTKMHPWLIQSGVKTHTCSECKKSIGKAGALRTHMITHTEENLHKCAQCGYSFDLAGNLKQHLLIHSEEKPQKCPQCDYASSSSSCIASPCLSLQRKRSVEIMNWEQNQVKFKYNWLKVLRKKSRAVLRCGQFWIRKSSENELGKHWQFLQCFFFFRK